MKRVLTSAMTAITTITTSQRPALEIDGLQESSDELRMSSLNGSISPASEIVGYFLFDDDAYITPLSFDASRASHTPEKTVNPHDPADPLSYPFIFDRDDYITPLSFDASHPSPSPEKPVNLPYKHGL